MVKRKLVRVKVIGNRGSFIINTTPNYYKKGDYTNETGTIKKIEPIRKSTKIRRKPRRTNSYDFLNPNFRF